MFTSRVKPHSYLGKMAIWQSGNRDQAKKLSALFDFSNHSTGNCPNIGCRLLNKPEQFLNTMKGLTSLGSESAAGILSELDHKPVSVKRFDISDVDLLDHAIENQQVVIDKLFGFNLKELLLPQLQVAKSEVRLLKQYVMQCIPPENHGHSFYKAFNAIANRLNNIRDIIIHKIKLEIIDQDAFLGKATVLDTIHYGMLPIKIKSFAEYLRSVSIANLPDSMEDKNCSLALIRELADDIDRYIHKKLSPKDYYAIHNLLLMIDQTKISSISQLIEVYQRAKSYEITETVLPHLGPAIQLMEEAVFMSPKLQVNGQDPVAQEKLSPEVNVLEKLFSGFNSPLKLKFPEGNWKSAPERLIKIKESIRKANLILAGSEKYVADGKGSYSDLMICIPTGTPGAVPLSTTIGHAAERINKWNVKWQKIAASGKVITSEAVFSNLETIHKNLEDAMQILLKAYTES